MEGIDLNALLVEAGLAQPGEATTPKAEVVVLEEARGNGGEEAPAASQPAPATRPTTPPPAAPKEISTLKDLLATLWGVIWGWFRRDWNWAKVIGVIWAFDVISGFIGWIRITPFDFAYNILANVMDLITGGEPERLGRGYALFEAVGGIIAFVMGWFFLPQPERFRRQKKDKG
ncbi:hypothetical protein A2716_01700 [candidate division WWE3 bacterium RIFCSPHIGHO2_01_FULL_40_23]|uniref:Uncharacterized protein n=1 Tax=candidate division WWE3 bacterium RIFCSPLOWO2_01_FULL_41_18 TaxID=1802625 RepID=A0A1F4VET7_UNCKA|nr:MAG: hypothetical protein A2716_01700 [candidate division WWE3 bacterium RIFCSPHIGHO2_01_FULL_40_23]OGC55707.1 MAG: hypothetical protein A3A78_01550 [candidate division WWE3 bacterium RIFCSPLOWO2_01_FULL_41_18]